MPLKILLAEDNLTNQKVALKQLQSLGYMAEPVMDGQQAVEAIVSSASKTAYNLILMDCQMPKLDGYEATQAIRIWETQAQHQPVVIVAMTANDLEVDRQRAIAAGMDDFISKPVRREALATLLAHWHQHITCCQAPSKSTAGPDEVLSTSTDFFQKHLDLNHLHLLSDHNFGFELELLQLFTKDSWANLALLQQAIIAQDLRQIEQVAHYLKGASANVGAKAMQAAADRLEMQAQLRQLQHLEVQCVQMHSSLRQIENYLDQHRLHLSSAMA